MFTCLQGRICGDRLSDALRGCAEGSRLRAMEEYSDASGQPWWEVPDLELNARQTGQLQELAGLLREWNARINLVSRKDMDALERHHLTHALLMARLLPWAPRMRVLDVGTGGGLPGLPLAIVFPEVEFFLCDSVAKKTRVVSAIAETLGLKNVTVINKRAETLESTWEFVIGRAVTALPAFLTWTTKNLRSGGDAEFPHGVLYLKGTRYQDELGPLGLEPFRVHDLSEATADPYFADKFLIHLKADDLIPRKDLYPAPPPPKKKGKKEKQRKKDRRRARREDVWGEDG